MTLPTATLARYRTMRGSQQAKFLLTSVSAILILFGVGYWLISSLIDNPTLFLSSAVAGLQNGTLFALIALGYTLVYGIIELINFAHGDLFMLGTLFSGFIVSTVFGVSTSGATVFGWFIFIVALIGCMAFGASVNVAIEFVAYRRLRNAPRLAVLITAVGMSFIVQNISLVFFDVNFRSIPPLISNGDVFAIRGVHYNWQSLFVILITIPVLIILTWLVKSTKQGKAMRATAQDPEASAMMGINVNRTISFTFLLAGGLAGIGAVLFLVQFNIRYDTGFELGLIAFTAAVLGGIGNLSGAVLGALIIGLIQAVNEGPFLWAPGSDWTRSIVFGILIAILVFRPEGLLGERTPEGG